MSTRTDAQHAYFARVPNKLLADLRSASGPILTFTDTDGQLHVNRNALEALERQPRRTGEAPTVLLVAPILFCPSRSTNPSDSRRERRAR